MSKKEAAKPYPCKTCGTLIQPVWQGKRFSNGKYCSTKCRPRSVMKAGTIPSPRLDQDKKFVNPILDRVFGLTVQR